MLIKKLFSYQKVTIDFSKIVEMDEKLIIIGGGVGPMAGVELHKKIIENTKTSGKDQEHLQLVQLYQ